MNFSKNCVLIYFSVFVKFTLSTDKDIQESISIQLEKHGGEGTINCTKQCDDDDWDWWFWYDESDSCQVTCNFIIKNETTMTTTTPKPKPDSPSIIVIVIPDANKKPVVDNGGDLTAPPSLPVDLNDTYVNITSTSSSTSTPSSTTESTLNSTEKR